MARPQRAGNIYNIILSSIRVPTDSIGASFIHATDFPSFYDGLGHIQIHATIAV